MISIRMKQAKLTSDSKMDTYYSWVGCKVRKDKKPFKSGNKINTVSTVSINPNSGRLAFRFIEDDSVVDCSKCYLVDGFDQDDEH